MSLQSPGIKEFISFWFLCFLFCEQYGRFFITFRRTLQRFNSITHINKKIYKKNNTNNLILLINSYNMF